MIGSKRRADLRRGAFVLAVILAAHVGSNAHAQAPVLKLRATPAAAGGGSNLSIELTRWSTDAERPPLLAALTAPVATPAPSPAAGPAGRGAARGRGGRGGREAGPPPNPIARLNTAVKAAPTVGYIWGDGPTGYAIKYAWHATESAGHERIVLATDRLLGVHMLPALETVGGPADAEFTVVELRLDSAGRGEGKTSLGSTVVVDQAAKTLALDAFAKAPVQLRITR